MVVFLNKGSLGNFPPAGSRSVSPSGRVAIGLEQVVFADIMSNVPGTKCCIVELVLAWHDAAGPAAAAAAAKYGAAIHVPLPEVLPGLRLRRHFPIVLAVRCH